MYMLRYYALLISPHLFDVVAWAVVFDERHIGMSEAMRPVSCEVLYYTGALCVSHR